VLLAADGTSRRKSRGKSVAAGAINVGNGTQMGKRVSEPEILTKLSNVTRSSNGWTAGCPAHDDEKPSLSVSLGEDGRVLIYCFAGCPPEQVVDAIGMRMADLMPTTEIVATYDYRDEHGAVLFQAVRLSPKTFRLRRRNEEGEWVWKMDGVRRVPYRLTELQGQRLVLLVEGEKDADNVAARGLPATTTRWAAAVGATSTPRSSRQPGSRK
jgi:putative DNA primase/helicase